MIEMLPCCIVPFFAVVYIYGQFSMQFRLWRLVRQRGRLLSVKLIQDCIFYLIILPWIGMIPVAFAGATDRSAAAGAMKTFTLAGTLFMLTAYLAMGIWLVVLLRRPRRLYRSGLSLVPMVVMALIWLTYLASIVGILAWEALRPGGFVWRAINTFDNFGTAFVAFIPVGPLANFVPLILHVWRALPAGRRTTMTMDSDEQ